MIGSFVKNVEEIMGSDLPKALSILLLMLSATHPYQVEERITHFFIKNISDLSRTVYFLFRRLSGLRQ